MPPRLTEQAAVELTTRWHDQLLDLESVVFDQAKRECTFTITEVKHNTNVLVCPCVRMNPLQRCRVKVTNVTRVDIVGARDEVELYINEVEASPTTLRLTCVNGILDITGEAIEADFDINDTPEEIEVTFATPLGDMSWRQAKKRG